MPELTDFIYNSNYNAFKNNNVYTGTFTISGTTAAGLNTKTFTVELPTTPDLIDIMFNGPTDTVFGSDPRPANGWFKDGWVWTRTNNAGGGDPRPWFISATINGTTLTVTATSVQQFVAAEAITSTDFSYRVIDYSIF